LSCWVCDMRFVRPMALCPVKQEPYTGRVIPEIGFGVCVNDCVSRVLPAGEVVEACWS